MLKLLTVFVSALSVFLVSLLSEPVVYVTAEVPDPVMPGSSCTIRMTVHKGHTLGFARIQQFLPEGVKVQVVEASNSQFIEDGTSIKFIWTQMPVEESFEISYRLFIPETMKDLQVINGVLIYLEDEKTEQYALPPIEVRIDSGNQLANDPNRPQVERTLIATVPELNEYRVELLIHPNSEQSAARFIDKIPEGYEAFSERSHGAHFLFSEGLVTFTWSKMPVDSSFKISYLVRSSQRRTPPSINGMLVFGNSAMGIELDSIDKNDELYEQALKVTEDADAIQADNILALSKSEDQTTEEPLADNETVNINLPSSKDGISYKVQISATMKSPVRDNAWFHKYYKLTEDVSLTYHEGWKKYLIGSFTNFKEANLHKRKTRKSVHDAFVVAYRDGQRISLQEAQSMLSINQ
ncbi:MAG TPA: hypothetical protein PKJ62_06885 [Bacteroidia bacterium]|nr:hypothetical protein [Bacteroidia bacterium]HNS11402.1 hypothetical protein [Bacteroidia bacterium]